MANAYFKTRWAVIEPGVFHLTDYSVSLNGRRLDYWLLKCGKRLRGRPRLCCDVSANSNSFLVCLAPPASARLLLSYLFLCVCGEWELICGFITFVYFGNVFPQSNPNVSTNNIRWSAKWCALKKGSIYSNCEMLLRNYATHGLKVKTLEISVVTVRTARPNM